MKLLFAEAWLRSPLAPMEAALEICQGNVSNAIIVATNWIYDPIVVEEKKALLKEHGEDHFLPSKATLVHHVWARAKDNQDMTEFTKAVELISKMQGIIKTGGGNAVTVNTNITTNKVMNVPVLIAPSGRQAGIDDWETIAIEQQQRLVAD